MVSQSRWPLIDINDRRLFVSEKEKAEAFKARVSTFFTDIKSTPDDEAGLDAQALYGDPLWVLDKQADWLKIQTHEYCQEDTAFDGYVGWVRAEHVSTQLPQPTHRVTAPRTFLYPQADMKKPRIGYRSMGSLVSAKEQAETRGTSYAILSGGEAIINAHIAPISNTVEDYVSVAETLLRTPYLWGGNTGFGIDCSGLVQLSMRMAGKSVLRDTDMQAATIGSPVPIKEDWSDLKRGDLVFWRGHVAIAQGDIEGIPHLIHANGNTMDVTSEPALQAIERIAYLYEMPIGVRRI